ncbi:hypothetical protein FY136_28690 (plasmid) [Agrobacterium tumefaciens]|uniref:hypothetical protein n=1 Tax=Agrobacterium tumefaciens TaxID=358 RepID=UPI0021CF0543|nr:hypothetical protein [Agrobacterium tumefaciens]UXT53241.1 hypothetical protein FY136_28690 [Agrobacterium tumefaciens]
MTIFSRFLCLVGRPSAKRRIADLQWEIERLRELDSKRSTELAKVTQERDILIKSQRYVKNPNEFEHVLTVDEAFTKCNALVNAAGAVMVEAVDHFQKQMEMITDVDGYEPQELRIARERVTDQCLEFLGHFMFDDYGTLQSIHLSARTAERIAVALREGEDGSDHRSNHLKVIK